MIRFFYRDELRVGDLIRCLLRLVVKVDISGRYMDEASHLPSSKVFRNGTFSYCRTPRRLDGHRVVVEPPLPQRMRETGASERLQHLDEGLHTSFPSRLSQSLYDGVSERAVRVDGVGLLAADHEREHPLGGMFADPEAEPAPPSVADQVWPPDAYFIQDRQP